MFSHVISRSSKVNQGHLGLLFFFIPIGYRVVKNDENMKMSYKDMPKYALNLAIWTDLAPQWPVRKNLSSQC